jgi:hypothetical protein
MDLFEINRLLLAGWIVYMDYPGFDVCFGRKNS